MVRSTISGDGKGIDLATPIKTVCAALPELMRIAIQHLPSAAARLPKALPRNQAAVQLLKPIL
jgi:hypothetical protein